jgi:hypothetical protein
MISKKLKNGTLLVKVYEDTKCIHLANRSEIAQRAAQLITNYAAHLRLALFFLTADDISDRAHLFDRVQKRILEHKQNLIEKDRALMLKLESMTSQCENVIQEVKTGTI